MKIRLAIGVILFAAVSSADQPVEATRRGSEVVGLGAIVRGKVASHLRRFTPVAGLALEEIRGTE